MDSHLHFACSTIHTHLHCLTHQKELEHFLEFPFSNYQKSGAMEIKALSKEKAARCTDTHCSNRKVRIQKKLQEQSETAMRTVSSRAFKRAPTQGVLPLDPKSINSSFHSFWLSLARNYRVLMISSMGFVLQFVLSE